MGNIDVVRALGSQSLRLYLQRLHHELVDVVFHVQDVLRCDLVIVYDHGANRGQRLLLLIVEIGGGGGGSPPSQTGMWSPRRRW